MSISKEIDASLLGDILSVEGTLAQRVYVAVRTAILSLDFPPGAYLRKDPICERLGVSRAPIADAISRLSSEGLVDVVPQSGTRISYISMAEIREGVFLRETIELASVALVARHLSDEQRRLLSRNMRLQELLVQDCDLSGLHQADEEFHNMLIEFTGFQRLPGLARTGAAQVSRARLLLLPTPGRIRETIEEHRTIYEAICQRDPEGAQKALKHHLDQLLPRLEKLAQDRPELFIGAVPLEAETQ